MTEEMLSFDAPRNKSSIIKVLGVGGGGSNAVTHMFKQGIKGVDFIICNTDSQAMDTSPIPNKIQLGENGLGAGSKPEVGRGSAEENIEDIRKHLETNTKMLFVTAGMGGGTGTGAAPVIAKVAKEMGILTVGIVTIPFMFEGRKRRLQAEEGIEELRKSVDTLLIISNEKLREMHGNLKLSEAFGRADDILTTAAKGIAEIITVTGYINVDFQDVRTVMQNSGTAIMGSAMAEGEDRARIAVKEALNSPLLNDNKISGASDILLYIASGKDEITFDEVTEITDYIQAEAGQNAEIIWGNGVDESLGSNISITLIATGFESPEDIEETTLNREKKKTVYTLNDKLPEQQKEEARKVEVVEKEPETEEVDEIKLIKKDKSVDIIKPAVEDKANGSNGMLMFDVPERKAVEEMSKPVRDVNSPPIVKSENEKLVIPKKAGEKGLRVSYTLGEFAYKNNDEISKPAQPNIRKEEMDRKAEERVNKLRELSMKLNFTEKDLESLEAVPAYVRKKVELNNVVPSSESVTARFTLGDEMKEDGAISPRENTFLHNKPD
jgi:cell division protein FtsZ